MQTPMLPHAIAAVETSAAADRVLVAALGVARIALPLGAVAAVAARPSIVALPLAPAYVRGVAAWRGQFIPTLDLAPLLGQPSPTTDLVLILQQSESLVALLVAQVYGEATLEREHNAIAASLCPSDEGGPLDPSRGPAAELAIIQAFGRPARAVDGGTVHPVFLLDPATVFALADLSALLG